MLTEQAFSEIVCSTIQEISKTVANLDLQPVSPVPLEGQVRTFAIKTSGTCSIALTLCVDLHALHDIAVNMRHGVETDLETAVPFVGEYFNILCGHIISTINRTSHTSARFSVPRITACLPSSTGRSFFYLFGCNPILFQASYCVE